MFAIVLGPLISIDLHLTARLPKQSPVAAGSAAIIVQTRAPARPFQSLGDVQSPILFPGTIHPAYIVAEMSPDLALPAINSISNETSDYGPLKSWFDEASEEYDVVRILLLGKAGCGKSTIVSKVFGFDLDEQTNTSANHRIDEEITPSMSTARPILVLHDGKGIERGSDEDLEAIKEFIDNRQSRPLAEQIHIVWYCIEIPKAGQRPFQAGDIALFEYLAKPGNQVPVVIVFTKYDRIESSIRRRFRNADSVAVATKAQKHFEDSCIAPLNSRMPRQLWMSYCKVSREDADSINSLIRLTMSTLKESEELRIMWASVQVHDLDLKVKTSLLVGSRMYYRVLCATFIPFEGVRRVTVLHTLTQIHRDIVRVWNMADPEKILIGAIMRTVVRKCVVEPMLCPAIDNVLGQGSDAPGLDVLHAVLANIANPTGMVAPLAIGAVKFLDKTLTGTPATARVIMAYITHMTLGMEALYWVVRVYEVDRLLRQNVHHGFSMYFDSSSRLEVQRRIIDYIGDENVLQAWNRGKAMDEITSIINTLRFNPATLTR